MALSLGNARPHPCPRHHHLCQAQALRVVSGPARPHFRPVHKHLPGVPCPPLRMRTPLLDPTFKTLLRALPGLLPPTGLLDTAGAPNTALPHLAPSLSTFMQVRGPSSQAARTTPSPPCGPTGLSLPSPGPALPDACHTGPLGSCAPAPPRQSSFPPAPFACRGALPSSLLLTRNSVYRSPPWRCQLPGSG